MDLAAEIPENSRIEKIQKFMKADIRKGLFIMMADKAIDQGRPFDWGKVSEDYARFRDIYPKEFYERIMERNMCVKGQRVLDLGTGTGVLPRNMYQYGAKWVGVDIAENQIREAKRLSKDMEIDYITVSVEDLDFPEGSFDVATACQCFWYFDHQKIMPKLYRILDREGRILVLYMAWLPFEDKIAGASEELVLKYNPGWSGGGETMRPIQISECYSEKFDLVYHEEYPLKVHFTRETWNGRMKACRGIGASLPEREIVLWEQEHRRLLEKIAPEEFDILHYGAMAELKKKC